MRIRIVSFIALVLGSVVVLASEEKSELAINPAYDKMKALVGFWAGLRLAIL